MNQLRRRVTRRLGMTGAAGAVLAAAVVLPTDTALADAGYITFDARATGAIYDFKVLAPDVVPVEIPGGFLASSAQSRKAPFAFGTAGMAPIPILTSLGLIIPQRAPVVDQPIPAEFQEAAGSVDYTKLPGYCQAAYPTSPGTSSTATCGGPSQDNADFGFTADGLVGRVSATADREDEDSAVTRSTSRAASVTVTPVAAAFRDVHALASTGLNADNVPEAVSEAAIAGVNLLGNTVQIHGIRSATNIAYDGTKSGLAGTSSFSIHAASVFGVPVVIGPNGFAVQGQTVDSGATKSLLDQINSQLGLEGFTMRIVPPTQIERSGSQVSMSSAGIEFSYLSDQVRYTGRIGHTTASVSAVPSASSASVLDSAATDAAAPGVGVPAAGEPAGAPLPSTVDSAGLGLGGAVPGATPADLTAAPGYVADAATAATFSQQTGNTRLLTGLPVASRLSLPQGSLQDLYLAFAATVALAALLCRVRSLAVLRALIPSGRG